MLDNMPVTENARQVLVSLFFVFKCYISRVKQREGYCAAKDEINFILMFYHLFSFHLYLDIVTK